MDSIRVTQAPPPPTSNINFVQKRIKKCHFSDTWLQHESYRRWISRAASPTEAHCFICNKNFSLSNIGVRAVMSHEQSKKHQLLLERITSAQNDNANGQNNNLILNNNNNSDQKSDGQLNGQEAAFNQNNNNNNPTDFLWSKALLNALGTLNGNINNNPLTDLFPQKKPLLSTKEDLDNFIQNFSYSGLNLARISDSSPSLELSANDQQNSLYSQNSPSSSTNQSHSPMIFTKKFNQSSDENGSNLDSSEGLTKCQLKQALIYLLQRDDSFISSLHQAYCDSLQDRMKPLLSTTPMQVTPVTTNQEGV